MVQHVPNEFSSQLPQPQEVFVSKRSFYSFSVCAAGGSTIFRLLACITDATTNNDKIMNTIQHEKEERLTGKHKPSTAPERDIHGIKLKKESKNKGWHLHSLRIKTGISVWAQLTPNN